MTTPCPRAIEIDGLANVRDLGGLPRPDGSLTAAGVFYRSDNVDQITSHGWSQLRDVGIRTIVDLRQPAERARDTSRRPDWVSTVEIDLDGLENEAFWVDYWTTGLVGTALYFLPHLAAMPERAGGVLAALLTARSGGVLFHCMGGRDRTGLIALLLLTAAAVTREAIVDDYLETVRLGDARAAASGRANVEPQIERFCLAHGTTTEAAFRGALTGLDLNGFLDAAHFSESARGALRTWRGAHRDIGQGPIAMGDTSTTIG